MTDPMPPIAAHPVVTKLRNILSALTPEAHIALCGHVRPDGDALGSVLGLAAALRTRGLHSTLLLPHECEVPESYAWIPGASSFKAPSAYKDMVPFDLFIALDTPEITRLGEAGQLFREAKQGFLIDHHPDHNPYTAHRIVDVKAAATGQLVWQLCPALGLKRTAEVATACYVALSSDTGSFAFSNTTALTLELASEMAAAGAIPSEIMRKTFASKPLAALKLDERILERIRLDAQGMVVSSWYTADDLHALELSQGWTENLIDLIRVVQGAHVAILIVQGESGSRVSLRSTGEVDVSAVAEHFGGGGHKAAAGISWPDKESSYEEILSTLLVEFARILPFSSERNA